MLGGRRPRKVNVRVALATVQRLTQNVVARIVATEVQFGVKNGYVAHKKTQGNPEVRFGKGKSLHRSEGTGVG
jgi:hypothetical protein